METPLEEKLTAPDRAIDQSERAESGARSRANSMLGVLSVALSLTVSIQTVFAQPSLSFRLQDDLGEAIEQEVELCFARATQQECLAVPPGTVPSWPDAAKRIRIEGPWHGPVTATRKDVAGSGGVISIPRKTTLIWQGASTSRTAVSLFSATDQSFERPLMSWRPSAAPEINVPAFDLVASISQGGNDLGLELIYPEPGQRIPLTIEPKEGWSLLVRTSDTGFAPVAGAEIRLASPDAADSSSTRALSKGRTDRNGLAQFSGLGVPRVTASISHRDHMDNRVLGIGAQAGTFAYRQVYLQRGSFVQGELTLDGRPQVGATCQIGVVEYSNPVMMGEYRVLGEAKSTESGQCLLGPVVAGDYTFRVQPEDGALIDLPVTVAEDETAIVPLTLLATSVSGQVLRGEEPADKAIVMALLFEDGNPVGQPVMKAETGDDGEFQGTVWKEGVFILFVSKEEGGGVAAWQIRPLMGGEEEFEFVLGPRLFGRVEDQAGEPVAEAMVDLTLDEHTHRAARTDESGEFEFDTEPTGSLALRAFKTGYEDSETVHFASPADVPSDEVVLRIRERQQIRGQVVTATGQGVPRALVQAYDPAPSGPILPRGVAFADAAGFFSVPASPSARTRLFVSARSGCALSATTVSSQSGEEPLTIRCPASPGATVVLRMKDEDGVPKSGKFVLLRWEGIAIPFPALRMHLSLFDLPAATSADGYVTLTAMSPGAYSVYLGGLATETSIARGRMDGFLLNLDLVAGAVEELEVVLREP